MQGYGREEYTHLNVAAAVKSGAADTGLGIFAAARALDLDFVPVTWEEYELCIPAEQWSIPVSSRCCRVLGAAEFQRAVGDLGGYDVTNAGQIRKVL